MRSRFHWLLVSVSIMAVAACTTNTPGYEICNDAIEANCGDAVNIIVVDEPDNAAFQ